MRYLELFAGLSMLTAGAILLVVYIVPKLDPGRPRPTPHTVAAAVLLWCAGAKIMTRSLGMFMN
jgi:hypothetical protein